MTKTKTVQVRMSTKLKLDLQRIAHERGMTLSALIRFMCNDAAGEW